MYKISCLKIIFSKAIIWEFILASYKSCHLYHMHDAIKWIELNWRNVSSHFISVTYLNILQFKSVFIIYHTFVDDRLRSYNINAAPILNDWMNAYIRRVSTILFECDRCPMFISLFYSFFGYHLLIKKFVWHKSIMIKTFKIIIK